MSKSAERASEELQAILAGISTKDLVDELSSRKEVEEKYVIPPACATIIREEAIIGPARILVVID